MSVMPAGDKTDFMTQSKDLTATTQGRNPPVNALGEDVNLVIREHIFKHGGDSDVFDCKTGKTVFVLKAKHLLSPLHHTRVLMRAGSDEPPLLTMRRNIMSSKQPNPWNLYRGDTVTDESKLATVEVQGATSFNPEVVARLSTEGGATKGPQTELKATGELLSHRYVIVDALDNRQLASVSPASQDEEHTSYVRHGRGGQFRRGVGDHPAAEMYCVRVPAGADAALATGMCIVVDELLREPSVSQ